ncbi:Ig-like domain-containing protein [Nakamurella sp. UYEF19]|uniref:Ig-like domain-containing protein n=1 Tax=Nakamurella sp. UYEF19 TaxID=1756392 RepID=UPI003399CE4B
MNITVGANTVTATPDSTTTAPNTPVTTNVRTNDTTSTGQPLAFPTVTVQPGHGTAAVNGSGNITYTPAVGFSGVDVYTYRVCDTSTPTAVCSSTTVTITVPNAVTPVNDTATTGQNTPVVTDVLANDTHTTNGAALNPASVTTSTPVHGTTTVDPATGKVTYTPTAGYSGPDSYTYQVCDSSTPTQVCGTATVTVTVGSNTVVANNDNSSTAPATAVTTNVLGNDTKATNGAALNPASVSVTIAPAHGATSVNTSTGAITYTPAAGFSGTDLYTYKVCDLSTPTPVCATATVTVAVPNAVTAVNDTAITPQNTAVQVSVLGNDTTSTGGAPLNPGSVTTTPPAHGSTTVNTTTGVVTYTPTAGYSGPDTFTYTVCDGSTPTPVCSMAAVSVTVGGNAVTAVNDARTTPPTTAIVIPVLANDTVAAGGSPLNPASVSISTPAGHGTTAVNAANGAVTYTPAAGFSGVDTFKYQVCDTSASPVCAIATVIVTVPSTVTAVNDSGTTPQNTAITTTVLTNDTITTGGSPLNPASVAVTTPANHGTTAVNTANGAITYTPAANFAGTDTYSYQVCDSSTPTPVCSTATVTITVPANTVTAVNDAGTTPPVTPITTTVLANDTVKPNGAPLNPATVAVTTAAGHGSTVVNSSGTITYAPANGFSGVDTYGYTVCDTSTPTPLCATATVTITVPNVLTANPDTANAQPNTPVVVNVLANDTVSAGGAPLNPATVVASTPAHGTTTVNPTTGAVTYTPAAGYSGPDSFTYTVCDTSRPTPVCTTATVVTVTIAPNVVTAVNDSGTTAPITPIVTNVLANDTVSAGAAPLDPASVVVVTAAGRGSTSVNPGTGAITYTPPNGFSGVDTYRYKVCDTSATPVCATATVTITVPSTVTAVNDTAAAAQNAPVVTVVLSNDTVTAGGAPLNPASVAVQTGPTHGTATVDPTTGSITYQPQTGYSGPDSYSYKVCDGSATYPVAPLAPTPTPVCSTATVAVTVGANTVTAGNDTDTTVPGTPVTTNVKANDSSSTGQPLANPTVTTAPGHGSTAVDPTTGNITYSPANGFSGVDTYVYKVCDTSNPTPVCASATVTITVPNVVKANADTATTPQNTPVTTAVLGNDTVSTNGAALNPASVTITIGPAHGTTTVSTTTGAVTYTPSAGYTGPDSYTYRVCDTSVTYPVAPLAPSPTPVCSTATVSVTVGANTVVANPDNATTTPGNPVSVNVRANDSTSTGQPLANPTVSTPAGQGTTAVDPGTGAITYTPANGFSGTDTFGYTVCDTSTPTPVCSTATVTVGVPNVVTVKDDISATPQNTAVATSVLANDTISANGAPLNKASVTVATPGAHGATSVNTTTGVITYTPVTGYTGPDSYTYTVCDSSVTYPVAPLAPTPTPVCGSATVNLTVGANVVTATPDSDTTAPGVTVTTNVRTNDTTSTGQPLAFPTVTVQPAHGTTAINGTGNITYTPAVGFSGTDAYSYKVCDTSIPTAICASTAVTITVPNVVTAVNDTATTTQNTAVTSPVLANDTHTVNGSPLNPASVLVTAGPAHGTTSVDTATGAITYTPAAGTSGPDSYSYQVCDSSTPTVVCAIATVTVTVGSNVVKANDDNATTPPGTAVTTDVLANDTKSATGSALNPASVTVTTAPGHGTTTVNTTTGAITYRPNNGFSGTDTYAYRVCDLSSTPVCSTATVTVAVPNVVTPSNNVAVTNENVPLTVNLLAGDTVSPNGAPLNPASVTATAPSHGAVVIDSTTGSATYTPTAGYAGPDMFTYTECDTSTPTPVCATGTVTITVRPNAVTAVADSGSTPPVTPITTNVLANDTVAAGGSALDPASVGVTVPAGHGTTAVNTANGTITYTPAAGFSGVDSYSYQVCDTSATPICAVAKVTITVPTTVTAINDAANTAQNTPVAVAVLANDTISAGAAPLNPASVTAGTPAHGTTSVNTTTGVVTYIPAVGYSGPDTFTYQVCDRSMTYPGAPLAPTPTPVCSSATVAVTVGTNTVTAVNDSGSTMPVTPVTTNVLANDTVSAGGAALNPASVTVQTPAGHGTTSVNTTTGAVTYTPAAGFSGVDTYTYRVCDSSTPTPLCGTATVTITVPNAVKATNDTATAGPNTRVVIPVLTNDTVTTGGAALNPGSVTTSIPAHGTTTVNPTTGAVTYTPAAGYSGPDAFAYTVCDRSLPVATCSTGTVAVTVTANTVTAANDAATTTPGTAVTTDVLANDTVATGGSPLDPASVTVTTPAGHGTTAVNPATGAVTYTPAAGFSGTDTYSYQVCDTSTTPVCATATVRVAVPSTVKAVGDTAVGAQNAPVIVDVLANDTTSAGAAPLNPVSVTTTTPAHGTTSVDPVTGRVTYTPAANYSGPDAFTYRVCDTSTPTPVCSTATVSVTIPANTVTVTPDTANALPAHSVTTNVLANDTVTTGGAPLNPASVTVAVAPAHGTTTVNPTTGAVTYTPATGFSGTDTYTYRVCDRSTPTPVCGTATVTVTVSNVVTANGDSATVAQNTPTAINVLANDTVTTGGSPLDPASVTVGTAPAHGTTSVDPTTGKVTYTPTANYTGLDSFTYRVCDSSTPTPVCSTATVNLTVGSNTVTGTPDTSSTGPLTPVTTNVLDNDTILPNGAPLDPASVTVTVPPAHGTTTVNHITGAITYKPNSGFSGVDTYTYRVCDSSTPTPVCATASVSITVPSVVSAQGDDVAVPQNGTVTTPILSNDTITPFGAPLDPASVSVTGPPTHGTTTVDPSTGAITYRPTPGYSGPDSYTYRVCDTSSPTPVCDPATVTVEVGTDVVAANPDAGVTNPATPVTIDVRFNDSTSTGQSFDNPTVSTAPLHGTTSVDPTTGAITYTPNTEFSGSDTFTYTVCDTSTPTKVCQSATVSVRVPNIVSATGDLAPTAQNTAVTTDVLTNDVFSPNGSPLDPASVSVTGAAKHGTTTVDPATGRITYTPAANYSGPDFYSYTVCDSSTPTPVCSTARVTVAVAANIVTAVADSGITPPITPVVTNVLANDTVATDGAPLNPASVSVTTGPKHGTTAVNPATGAITYTPAAGFAGTDTYVYQVCDLSIPTPVCARATVTITVPSVVTATADTTSTGLNTPDRIDVLGNDTVTNGGAPLDPSSVTVTAAPGHGTTKVNADGTITYTPTKGYSGPDSFSYQVCDTSIPTPVCSTATVSVTVLPNAVTAANDRATTPPTTPVVIDVLANDTVLVSSSPLDPASVTVTAAPLHGTTSVNPTTGAITYAPAAGFSGTDTYTYRVCDTSAPMPVCANATVTVTVPNAVKAAGDASVTRQNTPVTTDVLANDTHAPGGAPLDPTSVTVTRAPTHGSVSVDPTTGVITYIPAAGYSGTDTYTYRVCDTSIPTPACTTATVTITVGADKVVADPDAATTAPGKATVIDVLRNDSSATGQPLDPASVTVTVKAGHGTTTVDPVTGAITYTPNAGFSGTDQFAYRVCDTSQPTPVCSETVVTVTVLATVTAVDDTVTTPLDTPVTISILGNDTTTTGGAPLDPGSVSITVKPANGTVVVHANGTVTYTPAAGFSGTDQFTYRVCDTSTPTRKCATATVTITVPAATSTPTPPTPTPPTPTPPTATPPTATPPPGATPPGGTPPPGATPPPGGGLSYTGLPGTELLWTGLLVLLAGLVLVVVGRRRRRPSRH